LEHREQLVRNDRHRDSTPIPASPLLSGCPLLSPPGKVIFLSPVKRWWL
jgi:hypothetical protein